MGIFGTMFESGSPMSWEQGEVPGRKQSLRLEDIYDITQNAEDKYPESVWAPPPDIGRGPASNPYPEPYEFRKPELVAACGRAMKLNGMGGRYPRPWIINDKVTDYMAFPILPGKRLYTGKEPGRFRIVYNKFDGAFYRVVMHWYTTPLAERESAGLGFCWAGGEGGQESIQPPVDERYLSESPLGISYPLNDTEPHPLRQNPSQAKSPPAVTRQFSNMKLAEFNAVTQPVKSPPATIETPNEVRSPSISQDSPLVRSPPAMRQVYNIHSPPMRKRTVAVATPRPLTFKSPALGLETDLVTSPPMATRQFSSVQSPVLDRTDPFAKSTPTSPHFASNTQSPNTSYDPRFPRSPHTPSSPFRTIHSPILNQGNPTTRSPKSSETFSNIHSPITGYDPRLPRSPRMSTYPFNDSQSPIFGQETPPIRSPAVGMHPSRFVQSPILTQDSRFIKSPPCG